MYYADNRTTVALDNLEKKSVREILEDINREDQKVALAVQKAIPQIEQLVNQIVPRMKQGGRIFYMGAVPVGAWECWTLLKSLLLSECLPAGLSD